jgi:pentatricopeptide repeat protein
MDMLTFHTLMMGHTKRHNHSRVLQLYDEALAANIEVSVHLAGLSSRPESVTASGRNAVLL